MTTRQMDDHSKNLYDTYYKKDNDSVDMKYESGNGIVENKTGSGGGVGSSFASDTSLIIITPDALKTDFYTNRLFLIEYVSICFTVTSFIIYAILAYEDESVSAFAFSTDSFLDVLAYMVVIWRFSRTDEFQSGNRDRIALLVLSAVFLVSSVGVVYESVHNLIHQIKPIPSFPFVLIGVVECIVFSLLALIKFSIAHKLNNNKTVISDGVNSLIAAFSSLSMTIGMTAYVIDSNIWYLDAIFGFIMGSFVFFYGLKLFISNISHHKPTLAAHH